MATRVTCAECEELLALAALGVLADGDAAILEGHLAGCEVCRDAGRSFQATVALLPDGLDPLPAPAALRRRLLTEVYGSSRRAEPRRRPLRSWWAWLPRSRWASVAAAAALAAAVVLAVWGATRPASQPPQTFSVLGTTSMPQAHGTLTYYPQSSNSVVSVSGMPAPAELNGSTEVYELWLIPRSGAPVAAAFLAKSPSGGWTAAIHADLSQYMAMAATMEPAGGSPAPTGDQLLSAQLSG